MDFPLARFLDEQACYDFLVQVLHPAGLVCPRCGGRDLRVHRRGRAPVLDYRCRACHRVFNAFTGTTLHKTRRRPGELVMLLRGIAQAVPTAQLAREATRSYGPLLAVRHRLQTNAAAGRDPAPLPDAVVEADEMYQNAGEKRGVARRGGRRAGAGAVAGPAEG